MSSLERRVERLESRLVPKREPRVIITTINPDDLPENPYLIELSPGGLWAFAARGGPFTEEEISDLREPYGDKL